MHSVCKFPCTFCAAFTAACRSVYIGKVLALSVDALILNKFPASCPFIMIYRQNGTIPTATVSSPTLPLSFITDKLDNSV